MQIQLVYFINQTFYQKNFLFFSREKVKIGKPCTNKGRRPKKSCKRLCFPHKLCYTKKYQHTRTDRRKAGDSMLPLVIMAIEDEDDKAFMTWLYLQYRRLIYSEVRKITGNTDEVEDLLQSVVEKLIEKLPLLRGMEQNKLVNYIISTAKNTAYNSLRGKDRGILWEEQEALADPAPARRIRSSRRRTCTGWPMCGATWMKGHSTCLAQSTS